MQAKNYYLFSFVMALLFLVGCTSEPHALKSFSGRVGEIIVVIDNNIWNSDTGHEIATLLAPDIQTLPKPEKMFDLIQIEEKGFTKIFSSHRNIVLFNIKDTVADVSMKKSVWAKDQLVLKISAKNYPEAVRLLQKYQVEINEQFNKQEIIRIQGKQKLKLNEKLSSTIENKHMLMLNLPEDAYLAKDTTGFFWIRIERERALGGYQHQISQGLMGYYFPYNDTSVFEMQKVIQLRDSVTRKYISGTNPGSFMKISDRHGEPEFKELTYKSGYATQLKGVWRMENGFMAGGFVNYMFYDQHNNRILVLDGYIYCPQFDKREYLREIEAIVNSVAF